MLNLRSNNLKKSSLQKIYDEKPNIFSGRLFCSLMMLQLVPFLYTLIRTNLIADLPITDGLGIAGHIEWFDLINETIQAFLIVPLYALFHPCMSDRQAFKTRIFQSFLIVNTIYILFSVIVLFRCNHIVSIMVCGHRTEITQYLKLETIGFILGNAVSFVHVLFVVLEKPLYIYAMVVLKTIFTVIGDWLLIPKFGVNGAAYSNIAVSAVCVVLCLCIVLKEKLLAVSFSFEKSFLKDYIGIGLFSGFQIALDNIVYFSIVCRMVNSVAEQGNYWTANNIIWGLMLIPISALSEIIKKDCRKEGLSGKMKYYHMVLIGTFLLWICMIPVLGPFLKNVMGIEHYEPIRHILLILIPFYLAYNYTALFDSILIGYGRTYHCFAISAVVNLIYYPIVYGLLEKGVFTPNITFICMMFGFGMVVHLVCSILCVKFSAVLEF